MKNHPPISVVCDRCRAQGLSHHDPFAAFGALLDFDPVPRLKTRADGWDAEVQRAYIAALSLTGSDRAACRAVGRSAFGVTQLLAHEGGDSFRAAREQALAIAADERSRRLAEGLRAVAGEQAGWRPPDPPWAKAASRHPPRNGEGDDAKHGGGGSSPPGPADEEDSDEKKLEWLGGIISKYLIKVGQERKARLDGRIVEADFYLRQMTWIEVALDMLSGDGLKLLRDFRADGHDLIGIAETEMSKLLGELRREKWAELGEPPRPEHPPRRYLVDHGGYSTEPLESTRGGIELSHEEQRRIFEQRHRQDAADQILWEEAARQDYDRRRESAAGS
jgi:hypothetical protein